MSIRAVHRSLGAVLMLFIALHLASHLALPVSFDAHKAVLETLRPLYRPAFIEIPLLAALVAQAALGGWMLWQRGLPRSLWPWLQVLSGLYLVFFLIQHVPAVLLARAATPPIETDAQFAAALVQLWPIGAYGVVYYVLAVTAVFTHLAAGRLRRNSALARALPVFGALYGAILVAAMLGLFHDARVSDAHFSHLRHMLPGFLAH